MASEKIRVADYVFRRLVEVGIDQAFMLTGGGSMHLNDAVGRCHGLKWVCCHHEQACAIAAESYARVTGKPAIVNVTTGPGGINALNGVFGAWTDSIPMIVISGQVKRETCMGFYDLPGLRQLGDQEADIISMVKGITKYSVLVLDPETIRYHVDRAIHLATTGRPGPVWLDIPVDVQGARIDPDSLKPYDKTEDPAAWSQSEVRAQVAECLKRLQSAKRPVILASTGIRVAGGMDVFERLIEKLGIPVVTAWSAHDLIASDNPVFCGRPGGLGDRPGNFVVQNADLLLSIGCRLNIRQISYNYKEFAREAFKIQVDVDPAELNKPLVKPDFPILSDAKFFLEELERQLDFDSQKLHRNWLKWSKERLAKYPPVLPKHREQNESFINPYHFMEILFDALNSDDVLVCGDGTACVVTFQAAAIKHGQRMYHNSGCASMGYDLPAAVGAALAKKGERTVCLAGDGSIQLNIQELQTIVHHQLPIKIFVLNNDGYVSIRQTQDNQFRLRVGEGPTSGVTFPDIVKISEAYGIPARRWNTASQAVCQIQEFLNAPGPVLVDVILDPSQPFEPKLSAKQLPDGSMWSPPLEDMSPFLDPQELEENMLIPMVSTKKS